MLNKVQLKTLDKNEKIIPNNKLLKEFKIMEKVKLNKEQAEAIENLRTMANHSNSSTVLMFIDKNAFMGEILNDLGLDRVIQSIYIGYEVELTPEEQILQSYMRIKDEDETACLDGYYKGLNVGYFYGVKSTLDILNIKIKGINSK